MFRLAGGVGVMVWLLLWMDGFQFWWCEWLGFIIPWFGGCGFCGLVVVVWVVGNLVVVWVVG